MTLPEASLRKAVRNNPKYAGLCQWTERFEQIVQVLDFTDMTPGPELFAEAVAKWQRAHPPLKPDGMLGPRTWAKMEPETRFSPSYAVHTRPDWVRRAPRPVGTRPESTNIWYGVGVSYGGHFVAIGNRASHAWLFSLDDYAKNFVLTAEGNTFGLGLGGGAGVDLVVVTSLTHPSFMEGHTDDGWDIEVSLGSRWAELVRNARHLKAVDRVARVLEQSGDVRRIISNPLGRQALKLSPDDWASLRKRILELASAMQLKTGAALPQVFTMGIPTPYTSLELSAKWGFRMYRVDHSSIPAAGRGL